MGLNNKGPTVDFIGNNFKNGPKISDWRKNENSIHLIYRGLYHKKFGSCLSYLSPIRWMSFLWLTELSEKLPLKHPHTTTPLQSTAQLTRAACQSAFIGWLWAIRRDVRLVFRGEVLAGDAIQWKNIFSLSGPSTLLERRWAGLAPGAEASRTPW